MGELRKLFSQSIIYAVGSAMQSIVAFLLTPIYTRALGPAGYGILEIANPMLAILVFVLSLGMASALIKTINLDYGSKKEAQKQVAGLAFLIGLPFAAVGNIVIALFATQLSTVIFNTPDQANVIILVTIGAWTAIALNIALSLLRAHQRVKAYTSFAVTRFALVMLINIIVVVVLKQGVEGILLGNIIAQLIIFASLIPTIAPHVTFTGLRNHSDRITKALLAFGLPIIPASMSQWLMDLSDRFLLSTTRSLEEAGIYALGYKLGLLIFVGIVTPFQLAWPSISFAIGKSKIAPTIYAKATTYFLVIALSLTLPISIFANELAGWYAGPEFGSAGQIVWLVALSYVLYGLHFAIAPPIHVFGKTNWYAWILFVPALLNVVLNIIFIPRYGMIGAAATTLTSFAFVLIFTIIAASRLQKIPYEYIRLFTVTSLFIAALGASFAIDTFSAPSSIAWKIVIFFAYLAGLKQFNFFQKQDKELFLSLTNRKEKH